jgi:ribosomal protein S21
VSLEEGGVVLQYILREGEDLDRALRKFRRRVQRAGIFRDIKRHRFYEAERAATTQDQRSRAWTARATGRLALRITREHVPVETPVPDLDRPGRGSVTKGGRWIKR